MQSEKDAKYLYSKIGFDATEQQRDCNVSMAFPTLFLFEGVNNPLTRIRVGGLFCAFKYIYSINNISSIL